MSQTDEQAEILRRRRTAQLVGVSVAIALVFVVALVVLQFSTDAAPPDPEGSPTPSTSADSEPLQTLMIRVIDESDENARVAGNMLTGVGSVVGASAVVVPLPQNLVVSSSEVSPRPLQRPGAGPRGSTDTVSVTLGVRVDASWNMERKALAGLVDGVNGVLIDVPKRTVVRSNNGGVVDRFSKGRQRMSGTAASWYAVGQVRGESAQSAMMRFEAVMLTTLSELPQREADIRQTLTALGALSPSTVPSEELSGYLLELSGQAAVDNYRRLSLPVKQIGDFAWTYYPDATPLLQKEMPQEQWIVGEALPPRVLITAPSRPPGLILSTRNPLAITNYEWVDGRAVQVTERNRSRIRVNGPSEWGVSVAQALGLSRDAVKVMENEAEREPLADVEVILGSDYQPG